MIGKPFPDFTAKSVFGEKKITEKFLKGRPALINVWATWCSSCYREHRLLTELSEQGVIIYGINYKDDLSNARKWIRRFGNPYFLNISDPSGSLGLNLGVYGAPETFLVDRHGIIRYRFIGEINSIVWQSKLAKKYSSLVLYP